jgi:hypothetical protein
MPVISVDFESFYSKKLKYGLRRMIPEQYCAHELFDAYMISVCDGTTTWAGHPRDFNWKSLSGATVLSHNARFDRTIYQELVKRGLAPQVDYAAWCCTANLTSYLCNKRALDHAVEFLYGIRISKDVRADAEGKRWPQDFSESERADMLKYAKSDAWYCWKIWNDHESKWPEMERKLSDLTIRQGQRGVAIDADLLNQYIAQTHEMRANTEKQIPWLRDATDDEENESWDDFNVKPTATKCIAEQCRRLKIPTPPTKSKDEEGYQEWEDIYGPKHSWVHAVGAWRSINKLYQTFTLVKERLRPDGTLPFSLKYFGAHTGRWSGESQINMQNPRKRPIVADERGLLERDDRRIDAALDERDETGKLPAWVSAVIDFRSIVIPRAGRQMIVSDLEQIEPRVLAWLTGNHALLADLRGGQSLYVAFARTMGINIDQSDEKYKSTTKYKLAKAQVLALGYQCGWEKFIKMAADVARLDITADDPEFIEEEDVFTNEVTRVPGYGKRSKEAVADFRARNSAIVDLWNRLDDGFKSSIGEDFRMMLPSGRYMTYRDVRCAVRMRQDPKTKKLEKKTEFTADTGAKRTTFYGGKLTENLVQATARDVFGAQLVRMDEAGFDILFTAHDEAVLEVDADITPADVEAQMSYCPEWMQGCPISAKAVRVKHYCK